MGDIKKYKLNMNEEKYMEKLENMEEYVSNSTKVDTLDINSESINIDIIDTHLAQDLMCLLDTETSGYTPVGLDIIAIISILFSISVIIIKNPVSSVLSLIALFFGVACYLVMLGLTFIGLSYLILYVGAVSILFLFILMLINVRVSELSTSTNNSIPLVIVVSILYIYIFSKILPSDNISISNLLYSYLYLMPNITSLIYYTDYNIVHNLNEMQYVSSNTWDGNISEVSHIASIGNIMYTSYFIWLIITSIILLLAMVGCIIITIKDKTNKT